MSAVVLDASAVIALLMEESGAEVVRACLPDAAISSVNLVEVGTKIVDEGAEEADIRAAVARLGVEIVSFEEEAAFAAAMLRDRTRRHGLSLGDRACLALGAARGLPVLTTDRSWMRVDVGVEVRLVRGT